MSPEIHWQQIALRLALTLIAGSLLGFERSRTGHFAGLRTTLLVTLAASISMLQMNLLLPTNGKPHDSYVVMDLMRLPLGILTGVGFIGAGAILRKNETVLGVTTAATMWFATVVGLCLGGGQLILGSTGTALGFSVLWGLRRFERRIEHDQLGQLTLTIVGDRPSPQELRAELERAHFRLKSISVSYDLSQHTKTYDCQVRWPAISGDGDVPAILASLEQTPGLVRLDWKTAGTLPA
ncbi:MAG TPA: MgtC/SapB family protein [Terracidiphilus sp.]|jgi:putative Mg2+ transporter-C (MgtC) family protein|nr:MgtC/SapB family protein [Terracidiphilus sp.]